MGDAEKIRYHRVMNSVFKDYCKVVADREQNDAFWEENYKLFNDIVNSALAEDRGLIQKILEVVREDLICRMLQN